jgi:pre-rRNA-processing protein TSR4
VGGGDGPASSDTAAHFCPSCRDPLFRLVRLHTPATTKTTLQVLACNRASCIRKLFPQNDEEDDEHAKCKGRNVLCYGGGGGVVICVRRVVSDPSKTTTTTRSSNNNPTPAISHGAEPPAQQPPHDVVIAPSKSTNEWAMNDDDDDDKGASDEGLEDLEAKLAAMETTTAEAATTRATKGPVATTNNNKTTATKKGSAPQIASGFPCFELHSLREAPALLRSGLDGDDDDVGIGSGRDDRKIQLMLQKYMAVEEDADILAALRGRAAGVGGGSGSGERDERLSPADRALYTFTDRLKRAPRQVLRYARGGVPLWSV